MDAYAELLGKENPDADILVSGQENRVCDRVVSRQFDEIGYDERVDALLLARGVDLPEPDLDVVSIGQESLLGRRPAKPHRVVPVNSQERQIARALGRLLEGINNALNVQGKKIPTLLAASQKD